jgi:hypothetical protein
MIMIAIGITIILLHLLRFYIESHRISDRALINMFDAIDRNLAYLKEEINELKKSRRD